jgi:DNA-binding winged helix-turn-helix (wHTH) protein/tetratricopeptide (TPR) repeat protein
MTGENAPATPIDLAREADFGLGALAVSPSTREVRRGDWREQLEPRVMQVLVALHQAAGHVVSRDELIARCWEGRVVGDDAINRAIGRLRRLSEADGGASFEIETIARVGYRLGVGKAVPAPQALPASGGNRRWLIRGGAALLAGGAAGGALLLLRRPAPPPANSRLALQLEMAKQAFRDGNPEAGAKSAGLYEAAAKMTPDSATAWGGMALAYAYGGRATPEQADGFRLKAEDAIRHARALDPHEPFSYAAAASLLPLRGQWARREAILRQGLQYHPDHDELLQQLADLLHNVGRSTDAAQCAARANAAATQPDPALVWLSTQIYWCAGRLAEADAIAAVGASLFPRQRSCWFTRVYLKMFTGRCDEALAILNNQDGRPPGQPDKDFDAVTQVATALKTKAGADIDAAIASNLELAHVGAGYAENFVGFAAAMGRLDDAFKVADALYFDRGFKVGGLRFSTVQRTYTAFEDRRTRAIFYPTGKAMQHDPRFARLVGELGLAKYWKEAGVTPDYQRS